MDSSRLLWERFAKSGKLSDYLDFCEERRKRSAKPEPEGRGKSRPPQSSV
ncbi:MAG: hypothetical protein J5586_00190 [Clostridia bacterium]|nr:hypothetical protein [Clostridia bacterium]